MQSVFILKQAPNKFNQNTSVCKFTDFSSAEQKGILKSQKNTLSERSESTIPDPTEIVAVSRNV